MIRVAEISDQLASYLAGQLTFEQFEDWLIIQSHNMHLDSPQEAQELIDDIEEDIFQYLDGFINEAGLKDRLRPCIRASAHVTSYTDYVGLKKVPSANSQAEHLEVVSG